MQAPAAATHADDAERSVKQKLEAKMESLRAELAWRRGATQARELPGSHAAASAAEQRQQMQHHQHQQYPRWHGATVYGRSGDDRLDLHAARDLAEAERDGQWDSDDSYSDSYSDDGDDDDYDGFAGGGGGTFDRGSNDGGRTTTLRAQLDGLAARVGSRPCQKGGTAPGCLSRM